MDESNTESSNIEPDTQRTAGALLREARQAQGLHIAALAASMKVAQKKLEALENDRLDELPDATFARALAQAVCRALKVDPAPVLARLPALGGNRLGQAGEGINEPFREHPGRHHEASDMSTGVSSKVWGPLMIVIGAAVLYVLPSGWLANLHWPVGATSGQASMDARPGAVGSQPGTTDAADATGTAGAIPSATPSAESPPAPDASVAAPMATPAPAEASSSSAPTAEPVEVATGAAGATATGALQLRTHAASWIEVRDARSTVLLSRLVEPGETIALDGTAPFRLTIGNASATEVVFHGEPQDLAPSTRDNVARLELK
jgi:cytoskeleton protein RodZ